jgi:hypothetical protein
MKYFKTKYGTIINENNVIVPMQEGNDLYNQYVMYLQKEGEIFETDFLSSLDLEIQSNEIVTEPTKEDLILKVQLLEQELNNVKNHLNTL